MADLYLLELDLTLRLSTPEPVLALMREHMAPYPDDCAYEDAPFRVLAERGPAYRVGGDCTAELARTARGWTLTARQEIHAEVLEDVEQFLTAMTPHLATTGPLGSLRFYEDEAPTAITPDPTGRVRLVQGEECTGGGGCVAASRGLHPVTHQGLLFGAVAAPPAGSIDRPAR
ncbi:hypothetical protein WDV06_17745 [Streptomyces racemochromogenes]|uniref:Uncharacterized protein n=1 Tax=Streptomyces racemochromogenes TaxID=67353 RepID=A0ABW7PG27_9ACTN